jgi:NADPH:quinone reductase-like Zn-dependent oxidoreductase
VRAVVFAGHGGNEVVRLEERPDPVPGAHEVLVAARFAGINWADVMQRQGNYPPPPGAPADIPGLEVAGEVAATGPGAAGWQVGDRVFGQLFARSVVPLLAAGRVTMAVDRVFPAAEAAAAFDYLARPGKFGKILLEF